MLPSHADLRQPTCLICPRPQGMFGEDDSAQPELTLPSFALPSGKAQAGLTPEQRLKFAAAWQALARAASEEMQKGKDVWATAVSSGEPHPQLSPLTEKGNLNSEASTSLSAYPLAPLFLSPAGLSADLCRDCKGQAFLAGLGLVYWTSVLLQRAVERSAVRAHSHGQ